MDILDIYGKLKKVDGIKLERYADGAFTATIQQFDPHTGKGLPPQTGSFQREAITQEREKIAKRLAAVDELISDLDATPEK